MLLLYDIFNEIVKHAELSTLLNLYCSNKTIQSICLSYPFMTVLLEYRQSKYFNLNAKSVLLDEFLTNVSGKDILFLKQIQFVLGSCISICCKRTKMIMLDGYGKITILEMLYTLLDNFVKCHLDPRYTKNAILVQPLYNTSLSRLKSIETSLYYQENHFKIILDKNDIIVDEELLNKCIIITFRMVYNSNYLDKVTSLHRLPHDKASLSAFLKFLLEGAKSYINDSI